MKKQNKGFTIVELVIVIAVIAVLAAVLIPTFSSLSKRAKLNADTLAVRQMNEALKLHEKSINPATGDLYGKPADLATCMNVLKEAGFNADSWITLSKDYAVYWYQEEDVMILYNASKAIVEYPEEYKETWTEGNRKVNIISASKDRNGNVKHTLVYNASKEKALDMDTGFKPESATGGKTITELTSDVGGGESSANLSSEDQALVNFASSLESNAALKSSYGISATGNVYVNYKKYIAPQLDEDPFATTYAGMTMMAVEDQPRDYSSTTGEGASKPVTNTYYIEMVKDPNATKEQLSSAQKAMSDLVYGLFQQINENVITNNAKIVLSAGSVVDASSDEWAPVTKFEGYFGTEDKNNPILIKGARLTSNTSYATVVQFDGSNGKYFVTGFFGCVYGNTTIENVRFESLTIQNPAHDFDMKTSNKEVSRNSVGIVGGVIDAPDPAAGEKKKATNVTLRNIQLASDVKVVGDANVGGLVGYVGGSGSSRALYNGTLTIEDCHVSAAIEGQLDLETDANYKKNSAYGSVGGLIGFSCRCEETTVDNDNGSTFSSAMKETYTIVIKDTTFDGSVDGYEDIGGAVGNMVNGNIIFKGVCDFSKAKINEKKLSYTKYCYVGKIAGRIPTGCNFYFDTSSVACNETYTELPYFNFGGSAGTATLNTSANALVTGTYNASIGTAAQKSAAGNADSLVSVTGCVKADGSNMYGTVKAIDDTTPLSTNDGTY